jgi:DNA-binding LytR/AlgR family response regulator
MHGVMNILIVEDEDLYADQLEMLVEKMGYHCSGITDNSVDALALVARNRPDVLLMDVHIQGDYDGIELTQMIRKEFPYIPVVFITSMTDDMTFRRASRTGRIQFIVKPFSDLQLQRAIELAIQDIPPEGSKKNTDKWEADLVLGDHLFVKIGNRLEKIQLTDIVYIEANDKHCFLHLPTKRFVVHMPLKQMRELLDDKLFFQSHRSYLINISRIKTISLDDQVVLFEGKEAPISKRNREALLKHLKYLT